jgi:tRNA(Ile)-lysidine synthase
VAGPRRLSRLARRAVDGLDLVPSGPIVVALSGGPDSTVAAWAALESGRSVRAVHVHHGLPASERMSAAAAAIAQRLGIGLEVVHLQLDPPLNEAIARAARYGALTAILETGEWLVTGHTLDDQAETVLMNLVRGSGLDGLAGIPPLRPPIARPLLALERAETRELATIAGLPWAEDPANLDENALRNRIRLRLLPMLSTDFLGDVRRTLARTAAAARAEIEVLDDLASRVPGETVPGRVRLAAGHLAAVPAAVAGRAIRSALARLGAEHPPGMAQIGRVLDLAGRRSGQVPVAGRVTARRSGPWLELVAGDDPANPAAVLVAVPGSVRWGGFRIDLFVGPRPPVIPLSASALVLGLSRSGPRVEIGCALPGDRIASGGGSKPAAVAMAEAGIPVEHRKRWPVVKVDGTVVWIPWVRRVSSPAGVADRYLCAVATEDHGWEPFVP